SRAAVARARICFRVSIESLLLAAQRNRQFSPDVNAGGPVEGDQQLRVSAGNAAKRGARRLAESSPAPYRQSVFSPADTFQRQAQRVVVRAGVDDSQTLARLARLKRFGVRVDIRSLRAGQGYIGF